MQRSFVGTKIEVNQADYEFRKNAVLDGSLFVRIDLKLKDIKIKSTKSVLIDDREIQVTPDALGQLCTLLGMNKTFYQLIQSTVDADTELVNLIISSIRKSKIDEITLLFSNIENRVTAIYAKGDKLISDHQYFDTLEKVIAREPGSYLRDLTIMPNGNISAVIANPEVEFSIGNLQDETFTGGMTLDLVNNHLMTTFFTERLVC